MRDKQKIKEALKRLIDKNENGRLPGQMCMIARHPAMKKDIGKPLLREEGMCALHVGEE